NLAATLLQLLERRAADVERSLEVYVNDGAEAVRRKLRRGAEEVAGRAVDDDVYAAELLDCRRDGALDLREVAHVRGERERLATRLRNPRGRGLKVLGLAADERDA